MSAFPFFHGKVCFHTAVFSEDPEKTGREELIYLATLDFIMSWI